MCENIFIIMFESFLKICTQGLYKSAVTQLFLLLPINIVFTLMCQKSPKLDLFTYSSKTRYTGGGLNHSGTRQKTDRYWINLSHNLGSSITADKNVRNKILSFSILLVGNLTINFRAHGYLIRTLLWLPREIHFCWSLNKHIFRSRNSIICTTI